MGSGISSFGWLVKGWYSDGGPFVLAAGATFIPKVATSSLEVETFGMKAVTEAFIKILKNEWQGSQKTERATNDLRKRRRRQVIRLVASN